MNNPLFDNLKNFYKNPVKLFGLAVIILSLCLVIICKFKLPDFYIDRQLADSIAKTVSPSEVDSAVSHLLNFKYNIVNRVFQIWGYFVVLFLFSLMFKIKEFKQFKNLTVFNNRLFIYIWINFSYFVWACLYTHTKMSDIEKYVYNGSSDSMGIPFFTLIIMLVLIGVIYYPFMNMLSFITFNTLIKRKLYYILWFICYAGFLFFIIEDFSDKFIWLQIVVDFYYIVWLVFITYAIGFIKNKQNLNIPENFK